VSAEVRSIPGHPRYAVDANGIVYGKNGGPLALFAGTGGYLRFTTHQGGKWQQVSVHVMVCTAFHGARPTGHHAAHANGDVLDNRAANLAWKTGRQNEADKRGHGRALLGTRNHQAKLTADDVLAIRASGESGVTLARRYGVTETTISDVRNRKTWRHI
jgi:hypothetical protein